MEIIYRLAWELLLPVLSVIARFEKNLLPSHWRLSERLGHYWPKPTSTPTLWLHAASLGEAKGLWALAQRLTDFPVEFVLTVNTVTGFDFLVRQIEGAAQPDRWQVTLAPLDHPRLIRRFLDRFNIQALLLFEVELWPHFIRITHSLGKPVLWVSARLTPKAKRRYALLPGWLSSLTPLFSLVQKQSQADLRALAYLGNTTSTHLPWKQRHGIAFLSLHAGELPAVLPAIQALRTQTPVFIFPRKLHKLSAFLSFLSPMGFSRHSQNPDGDLLIVDAFGKIPDFLGRCHVAVVGGSFVPLGAHNLWEPLMAGVPMVVGPHHWNQGDWVPKLVEAGLLRMAESILDPELLRKGADPGELCRDFREREGLALREAVDQIRNQIQNQFEGM